MFITVHIYYFQIKLKHKGENEFTYISNGKEGFIKKQHHPKEEEEHAKPCEPHSNFCRVEENPNYTLYSSSGKF